MKNILLISSILLVSPLLSSCAMLGLTSDKVKIEANHSKAELYGHLRQAEKLLGMECKGGKIRVKFREGTHMSADRPWMGIPTPDGVATGHYWSGGTIDLYTSHGQFRPASALHEMAHRVLDTNGVPWEDHHRIMRSAGIP